MTDTIYESFGMATLDIAQAFSEANRRFLDGMGDRYVMIKMTLGEVAMIHANWFEVSIEIKVERVRGK
jgi:hypothetical protein